MANPSALPQLSDIHLNHLIGQVKELPYFDGNPSELSRYIARVEYLFQTKQLKMYRKKTS